MIDWLIERAKKTPYFELDGYMRRFWLVPYHKQITRVLPNGQETADGTGPVSFMKRPVAWLLQRCGIAIRVHNILRSDRGRHCHNHPWNYLTIILRGGYWENEYDKYGSHLDSKWHGPGSVLFRRAESWHSLTLPEGQDAWTLFITFRKKQTWGFNVYGNFVPYYEYEGEP